MEEGRKSAIKLPSWLLLQNWRKKLWFLWLCLFSPTPIFLFRILCCLLSICWQILRECVEKLRKVNPCKSWQNVCFESWQIGGSKVPFVRSFVFWSLGLSSWWRLKKEKTFFLKNTHVILERDVVASDDVVSAVFLSDFISGRASFSTHIFGLISVTKHQKCLCTLNISNLWKFYRLLQWLSKW